MTYDFDVVIVGCGPVGAYAANLFGRTGLRTLVLDREKAPYSLPRAVHIDHEMARLLADAGLWSPLEDRMLAADGHIHIGADGGVIRYLSAAGQPRRFGHANDYFFYQPELEEVLRDGLGRFPNVEMRLGTEVTDVTQDETGVSLRLADGTTLSAAWAIGCDGARSTVRKAAGIRLDDLRFDEPWLVVDAEVDGPITFPDFTGVPEGANLQRLSVMLCDPRRPATVVPGRGSHRRWEFMLLPGETEAAMEDPEVVRSLVAPWVKGVPHRIIRAATYRFHGLVAEDWRRGRLFLAGDAAHQTPPFFGQGMCHGLRDAANLAWKLELVQSGLADEALLDTYQVERDAQVRHVIGRAVEVGRTICLLDPQAAAARDARVRAEAGMKTAADLIIPLSSDIIGAGGGERFINPRVGDGLLDDVTGGGWTLLTLRPLSLTREGEAAIAHLKAKRISIESIDDDEGHVAAWFAQNGVEAVLIRPDFYLAFAGMADSASLEVSALGQSMGLRRAGDHEQAIAGSVTSCAR